jgi:hypothetical protein
MEFVMQLIDWIIILVLILVKEKKSIPDVLNVGKPEAA